MPQTKKPQQSASTIHCTSKPRVVIYSGGTMVHVRPHFSLCAPAYGQIGQDVLKEFDRIIARPYEVDLISTKMADSSSPIETNEDLRNDVLLNLLDPSVKAIVMAAAICDWEPESLYQEEYGHKHFHEEGFGKEFPRLSSSEDHTIDLTSSNKIIDLIKEQRPDIHLTTFKTTSNESSEDLFDKSERNLLRSNSDVVFGNDIKNHHNLLCVRGTEVQGMCTGDRSDMVKFLVKLIDVRF